MEGARDQDWPDFEKYVVQMGANIYVASDVGLIRYPANDIVGRQVEGLPSEDVHGVVADADRVRVRYPENLTSLVQGEMTLAGDDLPVGSPAPPFKLHYADGGLQELTLDQRKGKPTIIEFWGTR